MIISDFWSGWQRRWRRRRRRRFFPFLYFVFLSLFFLCVRSLRRRIKDDFIIILSYIFFFRFPFFRFFLRVVFHFFGCFNMWCHLRVMGRSQATPTYAPSFNRRRGRFIGELRFYSRFTTRDDGYFADFCVWFLFVCLFGSVLFWLYYLLKLISRLRNKIKQ